MSHTHPFIAKLTIVSLLRVAGWTGPGMAGDRGGASGHGGATGGRRMATRLHDRERRQGRSCISRKSVSGPNRNT